MNVPLSLTRPETAVTAAVAGERAYYNITEAAALLGVSRITVWRWIRAGNLPVRRLGHRTVRIRREDLDVLVMAGGTPATRETPRGSSEHTVQFYETDAAVLDAVAAYIGGALATGDTGIVVATPAHRARLEERLRADGLDVAAARRDGRYLAFDAAELLAEFMLDGIPDPRRFVDVVGMIMAGAVEGGRRVRAFGEMVALLALDGNHAAAMRLEALWNDLQQTYAFDLLCGYSMECFAGDALAGRLREACDLHAQVVPAESYTALLTPDDQLRAIAVLQQKAQSLAAEVAERARAEEQLRQALAAERATREEAQAALRLRDEFVSVAAHELKTPLTALTGQAHLLLRRLARNGAIEPERGRASVEVIAGQADRLARLVGQLLDITRLDDGRLALERHPVDLIAHVEQAIALARAASPRHTIVLAAPAALEMTADPLRIEQVLTNLLDNATKYSPNGGAIDVAVEPSGGMVELSVRDHGLGIPPEQRDRLFERYFQVRSPGHRGGLGLGLYITRAIVTAHGGTVTAEFPADGGTRFVVRLPTASN